MKKKGKYTHNSDEEFPVLGKLGLYAGNIIGDGNCLFRALSDQLYGDQERYATIRAEIIEYIKSDRQRFEPFTGIYDETFETYTRRMAEDATYGGHLEIVAFSEVHKAQVMIYQGDIQYAVNPQNSEPNTKVHIAYHTWEHYSSVRNKAGPHTGLAQVDPTPCEIERVIPEGQIPQWQVDLILQSVPECSDEKARRLLGKKDYNTVIEDLLTGEEDQEPVLQSTAQPQSPQIKDPKQERKEKRAEKRRERLSAKRDKVDHETVAEPHVSEESANNSINKTDPDSELFGDTNNSHQVAVEPEPESNPDAPQLNTEQEVKKSARDLRAERKAAKAAKKTKDFERKWAKKKEKSKTATQGPSSPPKVQGPIFI